MTTRRGGAKIAARMSDLPSESEIRARIAAARTQAGPGFDIPYRNVADLIDRRAAATPRKPFLIYVDDDAGVRRETPYVAFRDVTARIAGALYSLGVRPGDRVATVGVNHDSTILFYFGAWRLGACVVPINVEEMTDRKQFLLENSGAVIAAVQDEYLAEIAGLRSRCPALRTVIRLSDGPNAPPGADVELAKACSAAREAPETDEATLDTDAFLVYTSGTTGPPKGVLLAQRNLFVDANGIAEWHRFTDGDVLMCVLPIHHVNGTVVTHFTPLYAGATTVLNRRFKASTFWKRVAEEGVACVSVVPTLLEFLLSANEDISKHDLRRFRGFICGAGPLLVDTARRFEERFGFPIQHGYGLSETTCYSCFLPVDLPKGEHTAWLTAHGFPSIGCAIPHNEMAILDEAGNEAAPGVRGEIAVRGWTVCVEYYRRPDANTAAFKRGWFWSGDEGFWKPDAQGRKYFFITGRIKEVIARGGVKFAPLEIDEVLISHPKVKFGMAVGFENRFYGEEVAAYVVLKDGLSMSDEEILEYCRPRLDFKRQPKVVVFGTEIPYTSTGKPKRLELARRLAPELAKHRETQFRERR